MSEANENLFQILSKIDLKGKLKELQSKKYLPWVDAWAEISKLHQINWVVHTNESGMPYFSDNMGIFVKTTVTIENITHSMFMPVLNGANKAMKMEQYTYLVNEYVQGRKTGKMIERIVEPATSMDINTSIMRCLTKNIALFGLGIYVYQKEAMPEAQCINSDQLSTLVKVCSEKRINVGQLNSAFGIEKMSELYALNFEPALQWIEDNASGTN